MKMPTIFLSPSTQDFNPYVTRGNEEYWMNILADRIVPYLLASGIGFGRNDRDKNAAAAIAQSNRGDYDFHLSLHSNASPAGQEGQNRGIIVYYYPGSADSLRMAEILVDNLQTIYPLPEKVKAMPTVNIGEVRRTRAPAVLIEIGYHDNVEDATWVEQNIDALAERISLSVTEYFGVPFLSPQPLRQGTVTVQGGRLNIRDLPLMGSEVLARAENGDQLIIFGESGNWYSVRYGEVVGFANTAYVVVS